MHSLKQISIYNKSPQKLITTSYVTIITEFFELLNQSDMKEDYSRLTMIIYIGVNAINRVFEYVLMKTKNLEKTIYYSQQAYIYYLEYMTQIVQSNLLHSLNAADAIMFVYKKTICYLYNGECIQSFNTMTNIMTLKEDLLDIESNILDVLFLKIFKMTNILFYWNNDSFGFNDRYNLCNLHLDKLLANNEYMDITTAYLEALQQKMQIKPDVYNQLIIVILVRNIDASRSLTNNIRRKGKNSTKNEKIQPYIGNVNEQILNKFIIEESTLLTKFEEGNMQEFVRWIYSPIIVSL